MDDKWLHRLLSSNSLCTIEHNRFLKQSLLHPESSRGLACLTWYVQYWCNNGRVLASLSVSAWIEAGDRFGRPKNWANENNLNQRGRLAGVALASAMLYMNVSTSLTCWNVQSMKKSEFKIHRHRSPKCKKKNLRKFADRHNKDCSWDCSWTMEQPIQHSIERKGHGLPLVDRRTSEIQNHVCVRRM